jgi:hypothetical protein
VIAVGGMTAWEKNAPAARRGARASRTGRVVPDMPPLPKPRTVRRPAALGAAQELHGAIQRAAHGVAGGVLQ